MATYVNDLRLKEIATGDEAGTWGTSTNTNLELIGEALGYGTQDCFASDADATTTVADGASDPARAMYFKVTSSATLTATRTLTIAPNTISRVMLIENATTGSQSITISQGSGSTVTIASGAVKMVYLDGAGAGGAVVEALADLELPTVTVADLTATTADINAGTIDGTVIGGSTAAAGTFTTVTASGDVTLSGGTANGVAFANGSKVLTTGSTLTFDGTNTVTLNASAANLTLGISTNYGLVTATGTNPASIYFNGGSRTGFESHLQYFGANHVFFNETGGSEIMRLLNTGNVGIGVSSPAAKLEIGGAGEGIILASPDGTRYEITVANGGTLTVTAV